MTSRPSTGWDILDTALEALAVVTGGVAEQERDLATPCQQWNVTQVIQHATGDQLAWASAITGQTGPAENPFTPSGRLNQPPAAMVDQARQAAAQAWAQVNRDDGAVPTPLPQGPMPASLAAGACALDAAIHAWDLAAATGQPSPLTVTLAEALHPAACQTVEPLRGFAYAAALRPEPGDDQAATLLRYLGRQPDWKAMERLRRWLRLHQRKAGGEVAMTASGDEASLSGGGIARWAAEGSGHALPGGHRGGRVRRHRHGDRAQAGRHR